MNLDECRKKIDSLDDAIIALINQRGELARNVAKAKQKEGLQSFHVPERETAIIERLLETYDGPYRKEDIRTIFTEIFSSTLALEKPLSVSYLGPQWTYSYLASIKELGHAPEMTPCDTIEDVFRNVETEKTDYGMVPVENSLQGSITITLDSLIHARVTIIAERCLQISNMLLTHEASLKDIHCIYSHQQPLAQCRLWLKEHLPHARLEAVSSTAYAAKLAKEEKKSAAIGSSELAQALQLPVLAEHIEDLPHNVTRFFLLGRRLLKPSGNDKTSLLIWLNDRVGALYELLKAFAEENINLSRIESRPDRNENWRYCFFIDLAGHAEEAPLQKALGRIREQGANYKILGSYPVSEIP